MLVNFLYFIQRNEAKLGLFRDLLNEKQNSEVLSAMPRK